MTSAERKLLCYKLVCATCIFFGIVTISYQFYDLKLLYRCDGHHISHLSWLPRDISKELSETDRRELLQMVELWLMHKKDFSKKPISKEADNYWGTCIPRTNIFFLKIHKTGSSTIMNILLRYGEFHNLTFAFPIDTHQYDYPTYFSAKSVKGFSSGKLQNFNIMCHHMRFLLTEVEEVMPRDTFYFTILRNPVTLMESSFAYYKDTTSFSRARNLEDFLKNTSRFYQSEKYAGVYAKNLMAFDLGFNPNAPVSIKHLKLIWQAVYTMFDLILITEYFDESLVLLKDALCWTLDDILSFPLNARSNVSRHVLSAETKERIKSWNQLDWQLYTYFNQSFWNHVDSFGRERMKKEVEELRKRRLQLFEKCVDNLAEPGLLKNRSMVPYQPSRAKILGYNLKSGLEKNDKLLCHRLVLPELQYSELLSKKQVGP